MSLKGFHIIFIVFSTLLAMGVGLWCVWVDLVEGAPIYLVGAIASFVTAVALIIYGIWFYRKMKRLRIITSRRRFCQLCFCLSSHLSDRRWLVRFAMGRRMENRPSIWRLRSGFFSALCCRSSA